MREDVYGEEVALMNPFPALTTQHLYATVPRRHFDVQDIKGVPFKTILLDSLILSSMPVELPLGGMQEQTHDWRSAEHRLHPESMCD